MTSNLKIVTRKSDRKSCRLFGKVRYLSREADARILNLSLRGMAFETSSPLAAGVGSKLVFEIPEIGLLEAVVRWNRSGRWGVEYDVNSNASAKVASYFRFHHQEILPVLRR